MKTTYAEKLDTYEWKQRRKEILIRDNYTCQNPGCGTRTEVLHVHHKRYNGKIWESPDEDLISLCETCHRTVELKKFQERESEAFKAITPAQYDEAKRNFEALKKMLPENELRKEVETYKSNFGETPFIKYAQFVLNI